MKFIRSIFEILSEGTKIITNFLRLPSIKKRKKLKSHICNICSMEINTLSATVNNKEVRNLKFRPTYSIHKEMYDGYSKVFSCTNVASPKNFF